VIPEQDVAFEPNHHCKGYGCVPIRLQGGPLCILNSKELFWSVNANLIRIEIRTYVVIPTVFCSRRFYLFVTTCFPALFHLNLLFCFQFLCFLLCFGLLIRFGLFICQFLLRGSSGFLHFNSRRSD
jgi:hypothetical protein